MKETYIAVELDLHRSDFGKYLFSHYDILDEIYRSENSRIFKIKKLESDGIQILKAIKKRPFLNFDFAGFDRIKHEHIVLVDQTGESENYYYMVMEYIEGSTLEQFVEINGPCSTDLVLRYIQQINLALQYLHNHYDGQLIYRDLKPSNIMVSTTGKITLIDINTLRMKKDRSHSDTYYIGSRGYTAPEAYGYAQSTETSDVYSLGATLYFLLTGNVPSVGSFFHDEIKASELSHKYKSVILKATSFNPKDRYQSVSAFKHAINQRFFIKRIMAMASMILILTMATGFGLSIYQTLETDPFENIESDNTRALASKTNLTVVGLPDLSISQSFVEGFSNEAITETAEEPTEVITESHSESSSEAEPATEAKAEVKTETKTEPTTEAIVATTEDASKPIFITPEPTTEETTENRYASDLYTNEDIENMKLAGKGLFIIKENGYVNFSYNRAMMDPALSDFKYISAGTSTTPFDKNSLHYLVYGAVEKGYGFQTYTDYGFNETVKAGDYLEVMIFDADKKPIGYYFINDPYVP